MIAVIVAILAQALLQCLGLRGPNLGSNQLIVYTGDGGQGSGPPANRLPASCGRWLVHNRLPSAERPVRRGSTSVLNQPHERTYQAGTCAPHVGPAATVRDGSQSAAIAGRSRQGRDRHPGARASMHGTLTGGACQQPQFAVSDARHSWQITHHSGLEYHSHEVWLASAARIGHIGAGLSKDGKLGRALEWSRERVRSWPSSAMMPGLSSEPCRGAGQAPGDGRRPTADGPDSLRRWRPQRRRAMDGGRWRVYAQCAVDETAGDCHVPAALPPTRNQPGHDPASCCIATGPVGASPPGAAGPGHTAARARWR